jgi:three-Cys-motif partner protein
MAADRFHDRPFDDGTLTKLEIFQLYTREWLPVFLAKPDPFWKEVHVFDFFAGPGADVNGVSGSPLRVLQELKAAKSGNLHGWPKVRIATHFFDEDRSKIEQLRARSQSLQSELREVSIEIEPWTFEKAFAAAQPTLQNNDAAKLVLIDQFGVDGVSDEVFRELVSFPTCDFLFFISSATLHRFRDHPAIRQKIKRPDDYYHVHRAVADYYRDLLPKSSRYFLGRFSIKKGSNIYGLIYGSAHPLGMDKFLQVAWRADAITGEANFDIDRDDCGPLFAGMFQPTKVDAFQQDLAARIRAGAVKTEADVIDVCFQHGVKRGHAEAVLKDLKDRREIDCDFRVPSIERWREPKLIRISESRP